MSLFFGGNNRIWQPSSASPWMLMARRPNFFEIRYPPHHFSLKTVHRTVFLTLEPKGSNPLFLLISKRKTHPFGWVFFWRRQSDLNRWIRVLQTHALPLGYVAIFDFFEKNRTQETGRILCPVFYGADDEARTRYLHLGKVALYQMSYSRISRNAGYYNKPRPRCQDVISKNPKKIFCVYYNWKSSAL